MEHYREGAALGDPFAIYALGKQLLKFGDNVVERDQGFKFLSIAFELVRTFAMSELGCFLLDEESKFYAPERGLRYLEDSAARGDI